MSSELAFVLTGAFLASLAAGAAGFADAMICSAVWLQVLGPAEVVPLLLATGLVVHAGPLYRLRHAIRPARLLPFVVPGLIGVPIGVWLLQFSDPEPFRATMGAFLVAYSLIFLFVSPDAPVVAGGRRADGAVGLVSGVMGGLAGLSGVLPTIWSGLRGWPRDEQRGVYETFIFVMHGMALTWLAFAGLVDGAMGQRFLWSLPAIALGSWLGIGLYRRLDEKLFRRIVLGLLLSAGVALLI